MNLNKTIGIISDSHGNPESIEKAVLFFKKNRVEQIFHLGDICDSQISDTVDECVNIIIKNDIKAIKGNNDHAVVVNNINGHGRNITKKTLDFLQSLPFTLEYKTYLFTHSLPFVNELGLSAMIGSMNREKVEYFFNTTNYDILFRGHGHTPGIYLFKDSKAKKIELEPGSDHNLSESCCYVVTCGALASGFCLIWHRDKKNIRCISFNN